MIYYGHWSHLYVLDAHIENRTSTYLPVFPLPLSSRFRLIRQRLLQELSNSPASSSTLVNGLQYDEQD
jgi:hypothetical protein